MTCSSVRLQWSLSPQWPAAHSICPNKSLLPLCNYRLMKWKFAEGPLNRDNKSPPICVRKIYLGDWRWTLIRTQITLLAESFNWWWPRIKRAGKHFICWFSFCSYLYLYLYLFCSYLLLISFYLYNAKNTLYTRWPYSLWDTLTWCTFFSSSIIFCFLKKSPNPSSYGSATRVCLL